MTIAEWYSLSPEEQQAIKDQNMGSWWTPPDVVLGGSDIPYTVDDIPRLEAMGENGFIHMYYRNYMQ